MKLLSVISLSDSMDQQAFSELVKSIELTLNEDHFNILYNLTLSSDVMLLNEYD